MNNPQNKIICRTSKDNLLPKKSGPVGVDGWVDGSKICFKDCLQQSKSYKLPIFFTLHRSRTLWSSWQKREHRSSLLWWLKLCTTIFTTTHEIDISLHYPPPPPDRGLFLLKLSTNWMPMPMISKIVIVG